MPRPAQGSQLIALDAGALDFRTGDWWSTYKEARVFVAKGFAQAMAMLDLNTVDPLMPLTAGAITSITNETNWLTQLPVRRHWADCTRSQLVRAADGEAMLLCKAVIAMEALDAYGKTVDPGFDVYKIVKIIAAAYRPDGWTEPEYEDERSRRTTEYEDFLSKARALGQGRPEYLLHDLAKGHYATFEIAELVASIFKVYNIQVVSAKRPGQSGVAPASQWLVIT